MGRKNNDNGHINRIKGKPKRMKKAESAGHCVRERQNFVVSFYSHVVGVLEAMQV